MTNATRERAVTYLSECAAQIAPFWEPHIGSKVPPKEVLDFFDSSVKNLIAAEPGLLPAFEYDESQRSYLASDLLDVVIDRARQEVARLRQAKAAEGRANSATGGAEKVVTEEYERAEKERAKQERLAYLRAKRDAKAAAERAEREAEARARRQVELAAERAKHEAELAEEQALRLAEEKASEPIYALLTDSRLVDVGGALRHSEMNSISEKVAALVAVNWPEHGGQQLSTELTDFFDFLARMLLRGADPSDGTWDLQMEDGSIRRYSSSVDLSSSYSRFIGQLVLSAAKHYYTYEQRMPWSDKELMSIAVAAVRHRVELVARVAKAEDVLAVASQSLSSWQDLHPAPPACLYGVSPEGAEAWCRDWLVHKGMVDAEVTRLTGDGGVDVVSARHVVQVKHYTGSVSIAELRELVGVAAVEGKKPVFMTSGNYPSQAEEFADRAGMLLFRYDVITAAVEGCTAVSSLVLRSGFLDG